METTNLTQRSNKINPVATGIAGAVIGAGITAAAATMLRDKKNRQMLKDTLKTAGTKAIKYVEGLKMEAKKGTPKVAEKIEAVKEEIKEVKKEAKKAL
jgi:gas vesicle protein